MTKDIARLERMNSLYKRHPRSFVDMARVGVHRVLRRTGLIKQEMQGTEHSSAYERYPQRRGAILLTHPLHGYDTLEDCVSLRRMSVPDNVD